MGGTFSYIKRTPSQGLQCTIYKYGVIIIPIWTLVVSSLSREQDITTWS